MGKGGEDQGRAATDSVQQLKISNFYSTTMCNLEIVEEEMSVHIDRIFPTLLKTLSDSNDEVVILALRVLSVICKPSPGEKKHFSLFMVCI